MQLCTLPLSATSKLIQIREIYRIKTQGDVSVLMWGLAAYGCAGNYTPGWQGMYLLQQCYHVL